MGLDIQGILWGKELCRRRGRGARVGRNAFSGNTELTPVREQGEGGLAGKASDHRTALRKIKKDRES